VIVVLVLFAWWRIPLAFIAIYRLIRETNILRTLPWGYVARLPRRHFWIAVASACLAVGVVATLGTAVLPDPLYERSTAVGLTALWIGVISSWIRLLAHAWQGWRS
jgi:hypothetical protein